MKILCICSRGNVRSVMMAYLLREHCNHQAIAIGYNSTDSDLRNNLMLWADKIIVLDEEVLLRLTNMIESPEHHALYHLRYSLLGCVLPLSESGIDCAYRPDILEKLKQFLRENNLWLDPTKAYQGI